MVSNKDGRNPIRVTIGVLLVLAVAVCVLVSRWNVAGKQLVPPVNTQAIVDQFYPQTLVDKADPQGSGGVPLSRKSCFVVFDSFSDGTPQTIIAGYSNGANGAVRVIRAGDNHVYSVVYEPGNLDLDGVDCQAELVDVQGDGVKEVLIAFRSFRGPSGDWIFRWDGSQLRSLGPTTMDEDGFESSVLSDSSLIDFDHTGPLSLIALANATRPEDGAPAVVYNVYKLSGYKFVFDKPLLYSSPFVRRKGEPETVKETFPLPGSSAGPYTLRVINGERDGSRRASSARIVLNGVVILSPDHFSQQVEFLSIPVNLQPQNTIEVTLAGTPLGQIWISIEDEAAVQRARQSSSQP